MGKHYLHLFSSPTVNRNNWFLKVTAIRGQILLIAYNPESEHFDMRRFDRVEDVNEYVLMLVEKAP